MEDKLTEDKACNAAFKALPGGHSFRDLWGDQSVWINYDPGNQLSRWGAALGKEITLSQWCCRMGAWTIAATLIHEFAHMNGAVKQQAEEILKKCGLSGHFIPAGVVQQIRPGFRNIARA